MQLTIGEVTPRHKPATYVNASVLAYRRKLLDMTDLVLTDDGAKDLPSPFTLAAALQTDLDCSPVVSPELTFCACRRACIERVSRDGR